MLEVKGTERRLFTVTEVCEVLGIGRTLVYRAIQSGQLRIVKLGRSTRVSRDEVERLTREGLGAEAGREKR